MDYELEVARDGALASLDDELVDVLESALVGKIENVYKSFF